MQDRGEIIFNRRTSPFLAALAVALLGLAGVASSAGATFHLIKVREVFPGTVAQPESDYVELQSYSPFQNQVQFGQLQVYNAAGSPASPPFTPAGPLPANENQRTVLIADSAFATVFPGITPDSTDSSLNLSPAAGAVCWPVNSSPIDCVSWGAFTGNSSLPSSAGSPIGAIADGKAITRSISAGCPTLLEDSDDTDNSAADFALSSPSPRNNAVTPTEMPCGSGPAGPAPTSGGGGPAQGAAPKKKCKKHKHRSALAAKKCKKHK
jgi:hypothetical protein